MNVTSGSCAAEMPFGSRPLSKGVYIAMELVIAVSAIAGNSLVCLAVHRNKRLRTVTNYFLVSLAVADILVGLVAIPCAVLTDLGRPHHNLPLCLVLLSILIVLTQSSILSMLAVAAERYMAILLPFRYQRVMSPRNARRALLLTWSLAAITGSVPIMDPQRQSANSDYCVFTCVVDMKYMVYFNFFCCFLLPLAAMFVIYGHIFITVRHQMRRIAVARGTSQSTAARAEEDGGTCKGSMDLTDSTSGSVIDTRATAIFTRTGSRISGRAHDAPRPGGASKVSKSISRELRKAVSLFLVLFIFMLCWLPIHLINSVLLFCPACDIPMSLTLAAILLSHVNSVVNPILYAYRMRSFRNTLAAMWRGPWRPRPSAERRREPQAATRAVRKVKPSDQTGAKSDIQTRPQTYY